MSSRIASLLVLLLASPALAQDAPAPTPEKPEDKLAKQIELKPGGYLQIDQREFLTDTGTHELTVRRLRFKLDGKAFRYFKVYTLVDFAGSKLVVDDAYLEFAPRPELALRFGKNKSQFGIERLQSATELTFIERSYPTQIAPNRDIGIAVRGDIGIVHYSLAAVDVLLHGTGRCARGVRRRLRAGRVSQQSHATVPTRVATRGERRADAGRRAFVQGHRAEARLRSRSGHVGRG